MDSARVNLTKAKLRVAACNSIWQYGAGSRTILILCNDIGKSVAAAEPVCERGERRLWARSLARGHAPQPYGPDSPRPPLANEGVESNSRANGIAG